jgi:hypothetical protein
VTVLTIPQLLAHPLLRLAATMTPESTSAHTPPSRPRRWVVPISLAALALAGSGSGFSNQFVQDELPLILKNGTIHTLSRPAAFFSTPYWNDPFPPALYRPLATAGLALQWSAGRGTPPVYRWVSVGLLIAVGIALFQLGALMLPAPAAWAAAALFVVHPVHVEATAPAVNQGELVVALLVCLATTLYLRGRAGSGSKPIDTRLAAALVLLYWVALLFKESGLVLPGLLLAAESTIVADARPLRARLVALRPLYLALGLTAALFLALRTAVLGGDAIGSSTADALAGSTLAGRTLTMLGVVPHWTRLLFWPAHLRADYGPNELTVAAGWSLAQWAGTCLVVAWAAAIFWSGRRHRVLAFALLWIGVALFPVSNVLLPTGVLLAERTLFLASAGVALLAGWLVSLVQSTAGSRSHRLAERAAFAAVAVLLALGILRSRSRFPVWHDQGALLRQTVLDSPRSYTAHLALSRFLEDSGTATAAEAHYRQAVAERPVLVDQEIALADRYRLEGLCAPAVRHYRRGVMMRPGDMVLRASFVTCLLHLHRYREARVTAEPGVADPRVGAYLRQAIRVSDSALARGGPPGAALQDSTLRPTAR